MEPAEQLATYELPQTSINCEKYVCPINGGTYYIRELPASLGSIYTSLFRDSKAGIQPAEQIRLVAASLCDPDGVPLHRLKKQKISEFAKEIEDWPATIVGDLMLKALRMGGLTGGEIKAEKKD